MAIAAGEGHALALGEDGTVWAWGGNRIGQLGDETTSDRLSPIQVPDLQGVVAIASGDLHSLAMSKDGTVWGWGYNGFGGSVGTGTQVPMRPTPARVLLPCSPSSAPPSEHGEDASRECLTLP